MLGGSCDQKNENGHGATTGHAAHAKVAPPTLRWPAQREALFSVPLRWLAAQRTVSSPKLQATTPGVTKRPLCFEHLGGTCAPAGRLRRKSSGRSRSERQYRV